MLEQLQKARRSAGWSQRTLAIRIGAEAQAIKRLESGVGSVATLTAVMTALNFRLTGIGPGREVHEQLNNRRRKLGLIARPGCYPCPAVKSDDCQPGTWRRFGRQPLALISRDRTIRDECDKDES
jgi:transcriptional regulator with XRE-family HTH domain